MRRLLFVILLSAISASALAGYDAVSARGIDLSGTWALNAAGSDDAEAMLLERQRKERWEYERRRSWEVSGRLPGIPDDDDARNRPSARREPRPWQKQHQENLRRMLAISDTLSVKQQGTRFAISSAVESRQVEAGSHTQVSMPEGELADSEVGWDGEWFVIERRVRRGPRVVEKYRLVKKTGQLEYVMAWSGDSELAGMKIRRIFDRATGAIAPVDPGSGPVK
jgi:hypothetical protein